MIHMLDLKIESVLIDEPKGQIAGCKYAVKVTHLPTKISAQCGTEITSKANMTKALAMVEELVNKNEKI